MLISVASPYLDQARESPTTFWRSKPGLLRNGMKRLVLIYLCAITLGCVAKNSVDYRNFAIDTYFPTLNEIRLAEARARNYWNRNASRFGPEPRYLAVQTSKLFPGEIQDLYPKLINSETTASFFSHGKQAYSNLQLSGIMIYDTKAGQFVSNQGYVSVDTPRTAESLGLVNIRQDISEPEACRLSKMNLLQASGYSAALAQSAQRLARLRDHLRH